MKIVVNAELIKSLNKKKDAAQLNYFKKELIKVLEKNDEEIVSKAIEDYDNSIKKTYSEIGIEKAGYGIGTVRVWKGQKFRKIAPGKWRRIYDSNTRGARQSINIIKKKIANAKSIDELLQLVMENTNRFMDAEGKLLPIVEELQNAVKESKGRLNTGKPSTQEQIDKIKEENNKKYNPVKAAIGDYVFIHDKYKGFASHEFKDDEQKLKEAERFMEEMKELKARINKMQNNYTFDNNSYGISEEEYDALTDTVEKLNNNIYSFDTVINGLKNKIKNIKFKELIDSVDIENLTEEDKEKINQFDKEISDFIESRLDGYTWNLETQVYDLLKNSKVDVEHGRMWLKQHELFRPDELVQHIRNEINEKLAAKKKREKEEKQKALKEKIDSINNDIKTYTDEEISKSFKALDGLQKEIDSFRERTEKYKTEARDNKKAYDERSSKLKQDGFGRWSKEFQSDPEINRISNKDNELWKEKKAIMAESDELEKKLDPLLDAIGYYYLNKFEYEKDSKIDSCNTTEEVINLIKSKDWYSEEGKNRLELMKVDVKAAKDLFKCLERIFAIFPDQKGSDNSVHTEFSNGRMWACASETNGITLNSRVYKKYDELSEAYENSIGFHPVGTEVDSIIYHEYYHVMTTRNDSYAARKIKERVTKKLKMKGKKGGPKQSEVIAKGISEYATKNADEFGAECFCQALGSESPTQFAIEVFKETLKFKKYMRGLV